MRGVGLVATRQGILCQYRPTWLAFSANESKRAVPCHRSAATHVSATHLRQSVDPLCYLVHVLVSTLWEARLYVGKILLAIGPLMYEIQEVPTVIVCRVSMEVCVRASTWFELS